MNPSAPIFRFGPYELRSRTRELYKRGSRLKVRPLPVRLLNLLLSRAGDVVTREELREQLWSAETFVDFDLSLNTCVKVIRAVLNDSAAEPHFIETLPRIGYRFMAPVEVVSEASVESGELAADPLRRERGAIFPVGTAVGKRPFRWQLPVLAGAAIVLTAALGLYFQWSRSRALPQPASGRVILAVLPFQNLTGDVAQEYFSDGLTDEMIAQFGRLDPEHLGVIARTSVMHYKDRNEPLDQIGRELGAQYALEGSVRRDANKVRISAQLILIKDQTHVWSRQYDRGLSDLLAVQAEIAQAIGDQILVTLEERKRLAPSLAKDTSFSPAAYEAYDLYLKGRYFWNKRTAQGLERAIEYFQQAIVKDPKSARAYAGLADCYALISGYDISVPAAEVSPKARAAALKAVELDDGLAEAHTSLALIEQNYDWSWRAAEKEYRLAIQLNPNYATAHHWYAEFLGLQGRFDESFAEMARARQLDPLSLIMDADYGAILYFAREYDRAIEQFRAVLEMEPDFPRAHMVIYAFVEKGQFAEALAELDRWQHDRDAPWTWGLRAYVYGRQGQRAQARRAMRQLEKLNRHQNMDPAILLVAHIGVEKNADGSFVWLQKAYAEHSTDLTALKVDPTYDPLRSDARFQAVLQKMGW